MAKIETGDDVEGASAIPPRVPMVSDGITIVESRAPKTRISSYKQYTKLDIIALQDLAQCWARIGSSEHSKKGRNLTTEVFEEFLAAIFVDWNSGLGAPVVDGKPSRRPLAHVGVVVGTWAEDFALPRSVLGKRKAEQEDTTTPAASAKNGYKTPKARKKGADAWLTLSVEDPNQLKFDFKDASSRVATGANIKYNPGMTYVKAMGMCINLYDQHERVRVADFNRKLLVSLGRCHTVKFSRDGADDQMGVLPIIHHDDYLQDRFVTLRLARETLDTSIQRLTRARAHADDEIGSDDI
ncbi:hypothetical protein ACJ41O_011227 [Fusarium nematophilum]